MGLFGRRKTLEEKESELRRTRLKNRSIDVKTQRKKRESIIDSKLRAEKRKAFDHSKKGKLLSSVKKGSVSAGRALKKGFDEYQSYQQAKQKKELAASRKKRIGSSKRKPREESISPLFR